MFGRLRAGLYMVVDDAFTKRNVYSSYRFLEKSQWMKKAELKNLQVKRMKALLEYAYGNVAFYHEAFKKNGFHPTDFTKVEDLAKVPVMHRTVLSGQRDDLLPADVDEAKLVSWETTGTTASPKKIYRGKTDVGEGTAAQLRGYSWAGYRAGDKLALIDSIAPERLASRLYRIRQFLRRTALLNIRTLSEATMLSFLKEMVRFKPDYIEGYTAPTNILAVFLLDHPAFKIRPEAVFTRGQTMLPHYRRTIEDAFDCKVYDMYGSVEVSHVAAQCGCHEGMHVTEENVIVESVNESEAVSPEEEGKLLVTNLHSYSMPFIRYEIGDRGVILPDQCSCGRELALLKPLGRTYEYFVHSDGSFSVFRDLNMVFEDVPIKDFQIVQQTPDEIVIRLVRKAGYSEEHSEFVLRNVARRVSDVARIRIEFVDDLILSGSRKMDHVVSKMNSKYN